MKEWRLVTFCWIAITDLQARTQTRSTSWLYRIHEHVKGLDWKLPTDIEFLSLVLCFGLDGCHWALALSMTCVHLFGPKKWKIKKRTFYTISLVKDNIPLYGLCTVTQVSLHTQFVFGTFSSTLPHFVVNANSMIPYCLVARLYMYKINYATTCIHARKTANDGCCQFKEHPLNK